MYNSFQENLEKVPKILGGTSHHFTFAHRNCAFALQTIYESASTKQCYLAAAHLPSEILWQLLNLIYNTYSKVK